MTRVSVQGRKTPGKWGLKSIRCRIKRSCRGRTRAMSDWRGTVVKTNGGEQALCRQQVGEEKARKKKALRDTRKIDKSRNPEKKSRGKSHAGEKASPNAVRARQSQKSAMDKKRNWNGTERAHAEGKDSTEREKKTGVIRRIRIPSRRQRQRPEGTAEDNRRFRIRQGKKGDAPTNVSPFKSIKKGLLKIRT